MLSLRTPSCIISLSWHRYSLKVSFLCLILTSGVICTGIASHYYFKYRLRPNSRFYIILIIPSIENGLFVLYISIFNVIRYPAIYLFFSVNTPSCHISVFSVNTPSCHISVFSVNTPSCHISVFSVNTPSCHIFIFQY